MNTLNIFYERAGMWRPMFNWRRSGRAMMALIGLMLLIFPLAACDPSTAVGMALVNQGKMQQRHSFSYGPQTFYQADKGQAYFDITQGNNLYYRASQGWDFATGLGTPNLDAFYIAAP